MSSEWAWGCLYLVAYAGWGWLFRSRVDPWVRRLLGKRLGVDVIWLPASTFPPGDVDMGPFGARRPAPRFPVGSGVHRDVLRQRVSANGAAMPRLAVDDMHVRAAGARALPHDPAHSLAIRRVPPDAKGPERAFPGAHGRRPRRRRGRRKKIVIKASPRDGGETLEKLPLDNVRQQGVDGYGEYRPLGLRRGPGDAPSLGWLAQRPGPPCPAEAKTAAAARDSAVARRSPRPIDGRRRDQSHLTLRFALAKSIVGSQHSWGGACGNGRSAPFPNGAPLGLLSSQRTGSRGSNGRAASRDRAQAALVLAGVEQHGRGSLPRDARPRGDALWRRMSRAGVSGRSIRRGRERVRDDGWAHRRPRPSDGTFRRRVRAHMRARAPRERRQVWPLTRASRCAVRAAVGAPAALRSSQ